MCVGGGGVNHTTPHPTDDDVCICMYVCMYVYMYVCVYVCMYVCVYVCMYVCMYVCIVLYLCIGDTRIQNCSSYIYLGAVFSQDGSIETATKIHCQIKEKHVLKFIAFITKNTDCPFWVKEKGFRSSPTDRCIIQL